MVSASTRRQKLVSGEVISGISSLKVSWADALKRRHKLQLQASCRLNRLSLRFNPPESSLGPELGRNRYLTCFVNSGKRLATNFKYPLPLLSSWAKLKGLQMTSIGDNAVLSASKYAFSDAWATAFKSEVTVVPEPSPRISSSDEPKLSLRRVDQLEHLGKALIRPRSSSPLRRL